MVASLAAITASAPGTRSSHTYSNSTVNTTGIVGGSVGSVYGTGTDVSQATGMVGGGTGNVYSASTIGTATSSSSGLGGNDGDSGKLTTGST
jgi:hypothetical protein